MPQLTKVNLIYFLKRGSNSRGLFSSLGREVLGYKRGFVLIVCGFKLYFLHFSVDCTSMGMLKNYLFYKTLSIVISHNNSDFWLLLINHIA